ncbi:MAG: DUF433 domain-containing protein [Acidobacteriota bacterium]|nr:DUF433 domain-containing protein [Acidobacteriota bacterium]
MDNQYVEYRDEGYWIRGTRVSLDSIVYAFRDGLSPETIARDCFPSLSLEEVYGATAYYLGHLSEIDAYLLEVKAKAEQLRQQLQAADPEWYAKMAKARQELTQASLV